MSTQLDADELLRLAIMDINAARHDEAILKLKKLLETTPDNAAAVFLLAAEHAEIGLAARAEEGMARALQLDRNLHVARFQLGLLQYSRGEVVEAAATWTGLDAVRNGPPYALFKTALLEVSDGKFDAAIDHLEEALKGDASNPALIRDIGMVLRNVRSHVEGLGASSGTVKPAASAGLLGRYGDNAES